MYIIHTNINFKILLHTFRAIHNLAPPYLSDLLHTDTSTRSLRSSSSIPPRLPYPRAPSDPPLPSTYLSPLPGLPPWGAELSAALLPNSGTHSHLTSETLTVERSF